MKRIGLLSLALVLALGTLGVAYAPWTDEVFIEQTVETGTVAIGFSKAEVVKIEGDDKDVASAEGFLTGEEIGVDLWGRPIYEGALFVVENAYPCIEVIEVVDIASAGTIPVHITELDFSVRRIEPAPEEDLLVEVVSGTGIPGDPKFLRVWEDGNIIMNLMLVNAVDVQLHEGTFTALEIHKKFKQPMQQNATYVMRIGVHAIQYNEA